MSGPQIVVDSREKKPYRFAAESIVRKPLSEGDYSHEGYESTYAVERKSLDDLASSVGVDRLRFENEIRRANGLAERNSDGNPLPGTKPDRPLEEFAVVIEAPRSAVADYRNQKRCPNYYSDLYPESLMATVEKWPTKYETLDFIWAGNREQAKQETLSLLDKWYLERTLR